MSFWKKGPIRNFKPASRYICSPHGAFTAYGTEIAKSSSQIRHRDGFLGLRGT